MRALPDGSVIGVSTTCRRGGHKAIGTASSATR
jgi:hypothetical protein